MSNPHLTVTLKHPIPQSNAEVLTEVTLRRANTGDIATARAAIARHRDYGRDMMDDVLTLSIFVIPKLVVAQNVAVLQKDWVMRASEDDAEQLVKAYGALRKGYASIEEFEAGARQGAEEATAAADLEAFRDGAEEAPTAGH